ncbi:MAG TPA: hypothetical protein VFP59_09330 [Candidatus Angelobacter sp.]|nr:hypothetical protein [Candidatus Angelobacter sp.]
MLVSTPETGRHSHLAGWAILIVGIAIMLTTMDHWVKYLRMVLAGGILGGLLATESGHLLNGMPFPRPAAAGITALLIGCSLISQTLAKRTLRISDRVALAGFLSAFVTGMMENTTISFLVGTGIAFCFLFSAWLYNRFSSLPNAKRQLCD